MKINEAKSLFDLDQHKQQKIIGLYSSRRRNRGMSQENIQEELNITPELAEDLEKVFQDAEDYRKAKMHW